MSRPAARVTGLTPAENFEQTRQLVGYVPRREATRETYAQLGFKCGLEIHQQLLTEKKLFCHCPAGIYQEPDDFEAELVRHMRPTLSELGEYDGTALMEFRTRKNIIYRLKNETACTYDIDDTPPFRINQQALDIAIEIALMLKTNIVGELHITRKQYLDGSIPTGFQRTAIVGIEGEIPISSKRIRIIQLSIEEDSCREVSDIGHFRTYTTDRLGMPLIEMVTYPDMLTPVEAAEAADYLRFLTRSSGKVRTGIGAAREDVNVSVTGGTRVEIKGVAHIRWIPELTHNEAYRQWAMLRMAERLREQVDNQPEWKLFHHEISPDDLGTDSAPIEAAYAADHTLVAINLPGFANCLSFFTGPGRCFADEIADRLKVIACLEKPNMTSSEALEPAVDRSGWEHVRDLLGASGNDAQLIFWAPQDDVATALVVIEERCREAFRGVPNETRKSLPDGTTIFERVLPGPDRMYPDTDSAPIPITSEEIDLIRSGLAVDLPERIEQLHRWKIPTHMHRFLLRYDLVRIIERIVADGSFEPRFVGCLFGQSLRNIRGVCADRPVPDLTQLTNLFDAVAQKKLQPEILKELLPLWYRYPNESLDKLLGEIGYRPANRNEITAAIPALRGEFAAFPKANVPDAEIDWIVGKLRPLALGNVPMSEVRRLVAEEVNRG
ncbi:Glu-tRNA(Gln) amidotransferase subunit GatE [bacterium]|nr:Glu-tRNA(Gln) amidotransferase subunit GatE [bacterium]MCB2202325.1 Glu-tRNA(Gln) amidotransferase subunit GatE [bacterium]